MSNCQWCGETLPIFDCAHVCSSGPYAPKLSISTCPDCGKPTPEGSVHTCSPMQQIHNFGREQEALEDARDAAHYHWLRDKADWNDIQELFRKEPSEWGAWIDAAMKEQKK